MKSPPSSSLAAGGLAPLCCAACSTAIPCSACQKRLTSFLNFYRPFLRLHRRNQLQQAVALINNIPLIRQWGVQIEADEIAGMDGERAYAQAIHLVMSRKAAIHGKPFWGEKTPNYILHIPLLKRLFPTARFIHIYRDGRDVAISVIPLQWGPNNAYTCARWWMQAIRAWQDARLNAGEGLDLCYEDFVQDPETGLRRVCHFLGLPYERSMLDGFTVYNNRSGNWKNKFYMSYTERSIFEAVAGDVLQQLGYPVTQNHPNLPLWLPIFAMFDEGYKRVSNRLLRQ